MEHLVAKASKSSGTPAETTYRRVNWKGLLILGAGLLVVVGSGRPDDDQLESLHPQCPR